MQISIVIPTLERPHLQRTVNSALESPYVAEIIIIGNSIKIDVIDNKRVRYFHINEKNANSKRNFGIRKCNFSYILCLDDDDLLCLNSKIIGKAEKAFQHRSCVGFAMSADVYVNNKLVRNIDKGEKFFYLNDFRFTNPIGTTSSVLLRRDIIKNDEYFHQDIGCRQDYFCWIKVLLINNGSCFKATSNVGIIYNDDNAHDRTSKSGLLFKLFQVVKIFKKTFALNKLFAIFSTFSHLRYLIASLKK